MTTFKTSRTFHAPPAAVFAAFAAPQRLARWWGPDGFRNSFEHFDLRPGGHWRFTMHGPDGTDCPNEARFDTVEPASEQNLSRWQAEVAALPDSADSTG